MEKVNKSITAQGVFPEGNQVTKKVWMKPQINQIGEQEIQGGYVGIWTEGAHVGLTTHGLLS